MIVKYIALVFGAIFEIYCANIFISSFSKKKEITDTKYFVSVGLISVFHILASILLNSTILTMCSFLTVFFISQLYESKQYIKMILSITISIINISCEVVVSAVFMIIGNGDYTSTNTEPEMYAIGVLLSKFIVFLIVLIVNTKKKDLSIINLDIYYLLVLSILPITTMILGFLMNKIILVIDDMLFKVVLIVLNMLLILSNIITFEVIRKQNSLAKSEYELKLLKSIIDEQSKHYEDLKSSHEEIRQLRHNMRSICVGAVAELKSGKTENAIEELESNIDVIEKSSKVIDTGHPSIDSIIENKLNRCDELNINTNLLYKYKASININEIEISVILGNILDNAIEACQKVTDNKEVWGSIIVSEQDITINIKNTAVGINNLKTSKPNKKQHGFGLKSISHIAKKYNGYAKFSFSDNIFTSYVILSN